MWEKVIRGVTGIGPDGGKEREVEREIFDFSSFPNSQKKREKKSPRAKNNLRQVKLGKREKGGGQNFGNFENSPFLLLSFLHPLPENFPTPPFPARVLSHAWQSGERERRDEKGLNVPCNLAEKQAKGERKKFEISFPRKKRIHHAVWLTGSREEKKDLFCGKTTNKVTPPRRWRVHWQKI